jgi:hypothetical protein
MSPKAQLAALVRDCGLRLTLQLLASICIEEAERTADECYDPGAWKDWHKAKDKLLKMAETMDL